MFIKIQTQKIFRQNKIIKILLVFKMIFIACLKEMVNMDLFYPDYFLEMFKVSYFNALYYLKYLKKLY